MSFALSVLALSLVLLPSGWPQQLVALALLALIVWQGMVNHRRTDDLIYGQHRLLALTQELRGKQLLIQEQNERLAEQVDARTAELRDANLRLAAANLELLELDRLRCAVLSNVSHELRTPLTGILGSAQNLRDGIAGGLTAAQGDYVRMIERDSERLIRVANELLEWGRLQSGRIQLQRAPVAVRTLVDEVLMAAGPVAQRKGVRLEQTAADQPLGADADADKLKQILINLVDNAVKFSLPGTCVRVSARAGAAGVTIAVEDEGPGIAPEDLPHVFERFWRGQAADGVPGSGLGLAIAKNLARLHGGDLGVQPRQGCGTTFTLTLPAAGAAP